MLTARVALVPVETAANCPRWPGLQWMAVGSLAIVWLEAELELPFLEAIAGTAAIVFNVTRAVSDAAAALNVRGEGGVFRTIDVLELSGMDAGTLQNWFARGLLYFGGARPGRGPDRKYKMAEVIRIVLAKKLTAVGLTAGQACEVVMALGDLREFLETAA